MSTTSPHPHDRGWRSLGTLPVVAAVLAGLNGLFILLVAFGNITDYPTNQAFVQHVLSMDTTNFGGTPGEGLDPAVMWRAITDPVLQNIGYIVIIVWEAAAGILLAVGVGFWIAERGRGYRTARALSTIGLLMIVALFLGGFIAIGGEWFEMWRSTAWNGEDSALRSAILALTSLVFVHLPSRHWHPEDAPPPAVPAP